MDMLTPNRIKFLLNLRKFKKNWKINGRTRNKIEFFHFLNKRNGSVTTSYLLFWYEILIDFEWIKWIKWLRNERNDFQTNKITSKRMKWLLLCNSKIVSISNCIWVLNVTLKFHCVFIFLRNRSKVIVLRSKITITKCGVSFQYVRGGHWLISGAYERCKVRLCRNGCALVCHKLFCSPQWIRPFVYKFVIFLAPSQ